MHGGLRSGSEIPDPEYGEHFRVYRALSHPLCVFSHRHDVDFVIFGKVPGGDGELRTGYGFGSSLVRPPKKKARPKLLRLIVRDVDGEGLNRDSLVFSLIKDADAGGEEDSEDDSDPNLSDDSDGDGGCGGRKRKAGHKKKKGRTQEAQTDAQRSKARRDRAKRQRDAEEARKRAKNAAANRKHREENPETYKKREEDRKSKREEKKRKNEEAEENTGTKRRRK